MVMYTYLLVEVTIAITGDDAATRQSDERNKGVVFKDCAPFSNSKSEINRNRNR